MTTLIGVGSAQEPSHEYLAQEVDKLVRAGRFKDATPLVERLPSAVERELGADHPQHANALNLLAAHYEILGRYADAEKISRTALKQRQKTQGSAHIDFASNLSQLASIVQHLGRLAEAESYWQEAIDIRSRALGEQDFEITSYMEVLALSLAANARHSEAVALLERALVIRRKLVGTEHIKVAELLVALARSQNTLIQLDAARVALEEAKRIILATDGPQSTLFARAISEESVSAHLRGDLENAVELMKQALAIESEKLGPEAQETLMSLAALAVLLAEQGRHEEAHPLHLRALEIRERILGLDHYDTAESLLNVAGSFASQGNLELAVEYQKRALTAFMKNYGKDHPYVAFALTKLAFFLGQMGLHDDAAKERLEALRIYEARNETDTPEFARLLEQTALYRIKQKDYRTADILTQRAISIRKARLGSEHPSLLQAYSLASMSASAMGRFDEVLEYFRIVRASDLRHEGNGLKSPGMEPEFDPLQSVSVFAALGAWELHKDNARDGDPLRDEAFIAAQLAHQSTAGRTLALLAARQSAASGELARFVRERQDLEVRWRALDARLIVVLSAAKDKATGSQLDAIRRQLAEVEARLEIVNGRLEMEFSEYSLLANPKPLTITDTQGLLYDNEALLLVNSDTHLTWLISKREAKWQRIQMSPDALSSIVQTLRCGLDFSKWKDPSKWSEATMDAKHRKEIQFAQRERCKQLTGADSPGKGPPTFDLRKSHKLYEALFGEIEDRIQDKHLLIVPSGPLTQLPFQVLATDVTDPAAREGPPTYAKADWLIKRNAITVLPSVASLKALRQHAKQSHAVDPFVGFGNPLLLGREGNDRRAFEKQTCAKDEPILPAAEFSYWVAPEAIAITSRGGLADVVALRYQPPLPETADELCAVAQALEAEQSAVHLGSRATEAEIKRVSLDGDLARARVVHFATHGLLANETELMANSLAEPALLLTPPEIASEKDDGLLTASEVAQLRLDADWVVLSACNTAAGTGKDNAESLSGLARAFFYAGARALLVSHWNVDSRAAVKITTGAFAELKRDPDIGRAEALRRSMLAAMVDADRPSSWTPAAHPAVWAPFVMVGEGAR